jgi:hypothetical protein
MNVTLIAAASYTPPHRGESGIRSAITGGAHECGENSLWLHEKYSSLRLAP